MRITATIKNKHGNLSNCELLKDFTSGGYIWCQRDNLKDCQFFIEKNCINTYFFLFNEADLTESNYASKNISKVL